MTADKDGRIGSRALIRWLFVAAFIFSVIVSGLFTGLANGAGLFYLVLGSVAVAFMGFSWPEIAGAFRHAAGLPGTREAVGRSAYFWEAAARNAWMLGALGSALNFTIALSGESGGIAAVSGRMIQSLLVTLYGLVLAVVCLVPSMKLAGQAGKAASAGTAEPGPARRVLYERVTGYGLFAVVLVLTVYSMTRGISQDGPLRLAKVLLHWPAVLVVFGGAIAISLFIGARAGARALTIGFGMAGFISVFMGLIQALFGFVHTNVREIAAAIAFIISGSAFALLGLAVVAAPLEDRGVMEGRSERPGPFSRLIWVVFPILTYVFLLLAFVMVVTPMKKPAGM
jgi:hypothetical protein